MNVVIQCKAYVVTHRPLCLRTRTTFTAHQHTEYPIFKAVVVPQWKQKANFKCKTFQLLWFDPIIFWQAKLSLAYRCFQAASRFLRTSKTLEKERVLLAFYCHYLFFTASFLHNFGKRFIMLSLSNLIRIEPVRISWRYSGLRSGPAQHMLRAVFIGGMSMTLIKENKQDVSSISTHGAYISKKWSGLVPGLMSVLVSRLRESRSATVT